MPALDGPAPSSRRYSRLSAGIFRAERPYWDPEVPTRLRATAITAAQNGTQPPGGRAVTLRGAWRLAGLLFIAGTLSTIPGTFLLDDFEPWMYSLTAIGIVIGLACLAVPWSRVDERWLAVVPMVAIAEIALIVGITHYVFTYLYFFVALYVSLVFPEPRRMAPYLVLLTVALVAPVAYEDEPVEEGLLWAFAAGPGIVLTAVVVGRLTAASKRAARPTAGSRPRTASPASGITAR